LGYAIREYRYSIAIYPTAKAHTFLGWVLSMMKRYEEAVDECHYAIALDPDFGMPYNNVGSYLIELDHWEQAQLWLELALNAPRNEHRHYAHYHLGRVHEHFGRYFDALASYRAALAEDASYKRASDTLLALIMKMN
jgi:tetratricopeptide (TPR) repeat protein